MKWSLSKQSSRDYLPVIDGSNVILDDRVGEGEYCLVCTIPSLQAQSPSAETCFTVIRMLYCLSSLLPLPSLLLLGDLSMPKQYEVMQ